MPVWRRLLLGRRFLGPVGPEGFFGVVVRLFLWVGFQAFESPRNARFGVVWQSGGQPFENGGEGLVGEIFRVLKFGNEVGVRRVSFSIVRIVCRIWSG